MPFRSESQKRYLYATHPDIAKRWSKKYGGKVKKASMEMSFPESELEAYKKRLSLALPTYTTRVSAERGRYSKGQVVDSPFGLVLIDDVQPFKDGDVHPFVNELSPEQINQIQGDFDIIKFSPYQASILVNGSGVKPVGRAKKLSKGK